MSGNGRLGSAPVGFNRRWRLRTRITTSVRGVALLGWFMSLTRTGGLGSTSAVHGPIIFHWGLSIGDNIHAHLLLQSTLLRSRNPGKLSPFRIGLRRAPWRGHVGHFRAGVRTRMGRVSAAERALLWLDRLSGFTSFWDVSPHSLSMRGDILWGVAFAPILTDTHRTLGFSASWFLPCLLVLLSIR